MKKLILFVTFLWFLCLGSTAQSFNGGVRGALVVSQVAGDGMSGFNKAGLHGGFFVNYMFKAKHSVQMELAYVQKGSAQSEKPNLPDQQQYLLRLNYVEIPLLYQFHVYPWIVEAGFSVDFKTRQYEEIQYIENTQGDVWRKVVFNSVFGLKYKLSEHWMVGLRTINSVHSIRKNSVPLNVRRFGKTYGAYNDVLSFALNYQF